jgi:hypothetical protein
MALTKTLNVAKQAALHMWKKFANPTVSRGGTTWPKTSSDMERFGIRFDYDGRVEVDGVSHHKFQIQPNAGKVPTSISNWMDKNGKTTHATMANAYVKENATEEEVKDSILEALEKIKI